MALNLSVFRTRALSALLFVIVMLAGLLWNFWTFFILISIIHFGCWLEYQEIMQKIDPGYREMSKLQKLNEMLAGWSLMIFFIGETYTLFGLPMKLIGYWMGLFFWFVLPIAEILISRRLHFRNMGYSLLGLLYISLSLGLLMNLRTRDDREFLGEMIGKLTIIILIASIWINDTMAYLVGSWLGRTQLTKISPKKTWEGTVGGIILSVIVMGLIGYFSNREVDWDMITKIMMIAGVASVTGTFGDLLESKLKRLAQVKDSGHLMPGHGGYLDRFDSLLIATPFVWICILLFG
jgi:phosphatidate cytidylyltransferase